VEPVNPEELIIQGCLDALMSWIDDRALFLILVAVGIVILEILCVVMACLIIKNRK